MAGTFSHRFFSEWLTEYRISRSLLVRGLGLIYLIAILSWWSQAILLVGENGLVPAADFLEVVDSNLTAQGKSSFAALPNLFWITGASDIAIHMLCLIGCVFATLVILGFLQGPALFGLWAIYLTFVHTGNAFMSFQWDMLLLEAGFLALFVSPWKFRTSWRNPESLSLVNRVGIFGFWFLIAKLMFFSGWVKLAWATDANPEWWGEDTAMTFHYMTQPLPCWTAWWAHQLPVWFHKFSLWPMYAFEIGFPFLILFGKRARLIAAIGMAGLMFLILLTGNYTFFNWLTILLCVPLIPDRFWPTGIFKSWFKVELPKQKPKKAPEKSGIPLRILFASPLILLLLVALLNVQVVLNDLHRAPIPLLKKALSPIWLDKLAGSLSPYRTVGGYGLFRTMTTERPEIIVEGSRDGITWRVYDFKWKPDKLDERPRFVAPHQPRVAWQLWFAALEKQFHPQSRNAAWFQSLVLKLLDGDDSVNALFRDNPFPDKPPKFIRARLFNYEFTDRKSRKRTGDWWKRKAAGEFLPKVWKNP